VRMLLTETHTPTHRPSDPQRHRACERTLCCVPSLMIGRDLKRYWLKRVEPGGTPLQGVEKRAEASTRTPKKLEISRVVSL